MNVDDLHYLVQGYPGNKCLTHIVTKDGKAICGLGEIPGVAMKFSIDWETAIYTKLCTKCADLVDIHELNTSLTCRYESYLKDFGIEPAEG